MKKLLGVMLAGFVLGSAALAQAPAGAPAGSTGICKDGTYSTQAKKEGACRGHKGVQTWYVADAGKATGTVAAKPSATTSSAKASVAPASSTQAPGAAPAGATGICRDGTYSTQAKKQGACRGHKGVQSWYAEAGGASTALPASAAKTSAPASGTAPAAASKPVATPTPTAAPAPAVAPAAAPGSDRRRGPAAAAAQRPQAPGGGPGLVWVNTESNVYHCNGDVFYGKTKAGAYMSEADAKAKGARGERGKSCAGK